MKAAITGHQNLGSKEEQEWTRSMLSNAIQGVTYGYTSLAIGADQLFARLLSEKNIPYTAVLPCKDYQQTFKNPEAIGDYNQLLAGATKQVFLDFKAPSEEAFYEAGKYIVNEAEVVFAIWDGHPAKGLGGTADIVNYSKSLNKSITIINPVTQKVEQHEVFYP